MNTDQQDYTEATTGHAPHAVEPVPVTVVDAVQTQDFAPVSWSASQQPVSTDPVQVVGAHHQRTDLQLTNIGANTVWLAPTQASCYSSTGYPLAAGKSVELSARSAVWAVATFDVDGVTPLASQLALLAQYRDG